MSREMKRFCRIRCISGDMREELRYAACLKEEDDMRIAVKGYTLEEKIYLIFISYYFGISMLMNTMFYTLVSEKAVYWSIHLGVITVFFFRLLWFRSYSKKEIAAILAGFLLVWLIFRQSGQGVVLDIYFLSVLGKGMPGYAVMKVYLVIKGAVLAAAFIFSRIGILPDIVYEAYRWGLNAYAFGYPYYADLSANLLYFVFVYIAWRNEKLKPIDGILSLCLAGAVFVLCTTRTDSILLAICGAGVLWYVKWGKADRKCSVSLKLASGISILFAALGSVAATIWYWRLEKVLYPLNRLLSGRLERGREVLDQYQISFWGQEIPFKGYGGMTYEETLALWSDTGTAYLFADNSYLNIALQYGVLVLLGVLGVMLAFYYRSWNARRIVLCGVILLVMFDSVIVHHLMEPQYNLFLILFWMKPFAGDGKRIETIRTG